MNSLNIYEKLLSEAGIRITANRLLVLRAIETRMRGAFSMLDLADILPTMDTSSIFRTLSLFAEKKLLHQIDDGSGMQKYCVCHCEDRHHHHGHVHLTCIRCHHTICLEHTEIPAVKLPDGYEFLESEYVIKCICPKCAGKR